MTEFEVIDRYFNLAPARHAALGIGDDGALLNASPLGRAIVCDTMVEGRHFYPGTDPASVGHKALAVNLSDLAAMGARPECFLLALTLPAIDEAWLESFSGGMRALAEQFDCELVGGDTTRGPLTITVTAVGQVESKVALRRDRAEPGDDIWVSGELGAAAVAVQLLGGGDSSAISEQLPADARQNLIDKLLRPEPRVALGLALHHFARAAIDISDGLVADLSHIASRSRVGMELNVERIPVAGALSTLAAGVGLQAALNGGDDYELAFTAAVENRLAIEKISQQLNLPLSRIGEVMAGDGVRLNDARGRPVPLERAGHDHFGDNG